MNRDRALFEMLRNQFPGVTPTPSYLRQEVVLANNKNRYEFNFMDDSATSASPANRLLKRPDLFVSNVMGLFLLREAAAAKGSGILKSYVDSVTFAAATGFTPANLNAVYNGFLEADVDKNNVFEALETHRFHVIPQRQAAAAIPDVSAAFDSEKTPVDGFSIIEPGLKLNGERKNKITLNIPFVTEIASVTAGTDNKVVIFLKGFLLAGAAASDLQQQGYF